jgi:hypothetical protein
MEPMSPAKKRRETDITIRFPDRNYLKALNTNAPRIENRSEFTIFSWSAQAKDRFWPLGGIADPN